MTVFNVIPRLSGCDVQLDVEPGSLVLVVINRSDERSHRKIELAQLDDYCVCTDEQKEEIARHLRSGGREVVEFRTRPAGPAARDVLDHLEAVHPGQPEKQLDVLAEFVESEPQLVDALTHWMGRNVDDFKDEPSVLGLAVSALVQQDPTQPMLVYVMADGDESVTFCRSMTDHARVRLLRSLLEQLLESQPLDVLSPTSQISRLLCEDDGDRLEDRLKDPRVAR
jgi:hypothetical protein